MSLFWKRRDEAAAPAEELSPLEKAKRELEERQRVAREKLEGRPPARQERPAAAEAADEGDVSVGELPGELPVGDPPVGDLPERDVPVVEFRDVEKTFAAGTRHAFTAIKEVNFRITDRPGAGEFIAIVGPSGSGKSTILNLIQGFSDVHPPTRGEILVRGRRVTGPGRDRGMIFQRYSSFPHRTVLQNVTFGLEINARELGLGRAERREQAMEMIQRVGLDGHQHKYPHQLSGGQQQRVAIARSLVLKPRILLMDEPFSALDEPTRYDMQRLITELWHDIQATVFLVTHSISEAVYLGDRVWIITPSPGTIGAEFDDVLPPRRDADPLHVQESPRFQEVVGEVARAFSRIEAAGSPLRGAQS